jgi:circadian clock protein KaiB
MTDPDAEDELRWALTLYVSGASPRSAAAIRTLEKICNGELDGRVDLTIVDVRGKPLPDLGKIVAIPTLVKSQPEPVRYLVGDLTDEPRLREGLDLGPAPVAEDAP